ncbi:MAG: ankyrin repeat domain-containing protein [Rhodospirillales bacterium]|nr:ankyrin repeat domain-containing protein [Rhodospirillales bacterium]
MTKAIAMSVALHLVLGLFTFEAVSGDAALGLVSGIIAFILFLTMLFGAFWLLITSAMTIAAVAGALIVVVSMGALMSGMFDANAKITAMKDPVKVEMLTIKNLSKDVQDTIARAEIAMAALQKQTGASEITKSNVTKLSKSAAVTKTKLRPWLSLKSKTENEQPGHQSNANATSSVQLARGNEMRKAVTKQLRDQASAKLLDANAEHLESRPEKISKIFGQIGKSVRRLETLRMAMLKQKPTTETKAKTKAKTKEQRSISRNIEQLAKEGYPHAQFSLAEHYLTKDHKKAEIATDAALAKQYLNHAALAGHSPSQMVLAMLAAQDTPDPDLAKAHAWLGAAEKHGIKAVHTARDQLAKLMAPQDKIKARRQQLELEKIISMLATHSPAVQKGLSKKLQVAAKVGDVEQIHLLLAQDADPDTGDKDGRTPLIEAAWRGYNGIVSTLLHAGAQVDRLDANGRGALAWAAINGHGNIIPTLIKAGAHVNIRDGDGFTPLMRAAWNGHMGAAKALLQAGADQTPKNRFGKTASDYARQEGHHDILRLFNQN